MWGPTTRIVLGGLLGACGFDHGLIGIDAAPPDIADTTPRTCATLHMAQPMMPSGSYLIDPDGPGNDASLQVQCDMTTDGGGWTIVYFSASANTSGMPGYTAATASLLGDAVQVLATYRDAMQNQSGDRALFAIPDEWKTRAPFLSSATDIVTAVSINGANAITATLRYGNQNFGPTCMSPWTPSGGAYGRFCITNTKAPFYTGFAATAVDGCQDSLEPWDAKTCSDDRRFSLAIR